MAEHQLRLYLPLIANDKRLLFESKEEHKKYAILVTKKFARIAGGANMSLSDVTAWEDDNDDIEMQPCYVISCNYTDSPQVRAEFLSLVEEIKKKLKQDYIAVEDLLCDFWLC
jgi:hypothetical protein